jgi:hypothetical protein
MSEERFMNDEHSDKLLDLLYYLHEWHFRGRSEVKPNSKITYVEIKYGNSTGVDDVICFDMTRIHELKATMRRVAIDLWKAKSGDQYPSNEGGHRDKYTNLEAGLI